MKRYLVGPALGLALGLGIVFAALFGTVEHGAQLMASAEQAGDAKFKTTTSTATPPAATVPEARGKRRGEPAVLEIPEGMCAVEVGNPASISHGFILPGMRVDIIASEPTEKGVAAEIVVSDVAVLAHRDVNWRGPKGEYYDGVTTVAVRKDDAVKLKRAIEKWSSVGVSLRPLPGEHLIPLVSPANLRRQGEGQN
jgi:hypothetical protein